jgi:predicted ATPase
MQRLVIRNFGPIKKLDLKIKDFLVFIGAQASGKSTISKSIYFFKSLLNFLS